MILCCDTSFLHSFYVDDVYSASAKKYMVQSSSVPLITPFNRFEFYNPLRLSEFRRLLPKKQAALLIAAFEKDLAMVAAEAHHLSATYVTQEGYRSFDILHVAAALHLQAETFLTFDKKQQTLAKSRGLKTPLLI